jgi:hypothetical protein
MDLFIISTARNKRKRLDSHLAHAHTTHLLAPSQSDLSHTTPHHYLATTHMLQ